MVARRPLGEAWPDYWRSPRPRPADKKRRELRAAAPPQLLASRASPAGRARTPGYPVTQSNPECKARNENAEVRVADAPFASTRIAGAT